MGLKDDITYDITTEEANRLIAEAEAARANDRQDIRNSRALQRLRDALDELRVSKPDDRSDLDRVYAVAITDVQKVIGFFKEWGINRAYIPPEEG